MATHSSILAVFLVTLSCPTLCNPMDCSPPGSSVNISVQFSSVTQSCPALCDPMDCSTPGLPVHHQLPEFTQLMSIDSVMPSNHLILCCPLLLLSSIFPSIRVFSSESVLRIRWPKYWSFSISLSNEYSRLISFRIDCLDLLAVQGTLKNLLQFSSVTQSCPALCDPMSCSTPDFPVQHQFPEPTQTHVH